MGYNFSNGKMRFSRCVDSGNVIISVVRQKDKVRRSYCANADLFNGRVYNGVKNRLSAEEYKRQQDFIDSL